MLKISFENCVKNKREENKKTKEVFVFFSWFFYVPIRQILWNRESVG